MGGGGLRPFPVLLSHLFPIITILSTPLLTGMTGTSLHVASDLSVTCKFSRPEKNVLFSLPFKLHALIQLRVPSPSSSYFQLPYRRHLRQELQGQVRDGRRVRQGRHEIRCCCTGAKHYFTALVWWGWACFVYHNCYILV
jgi:hypothetical protein